MKSEITKKEITLFVFSILITTLNCLFFLMNYFEPTIIKNVISITTLTISCVLLFNLLRKINNVKEINKPYIFWIASSFVLAFLLPFCIITFFLWEDLKLKKLFTAKSREVKVPFRYKLLRLTKLFFSSKTQKQTFEQIVGDWDEEIFEELRKDINTKAFFINARNTYAFILAMWQKSPIGDLIEFVRKIAS